METGPGLELLGNECSISVVNLDRFIHCECCHYESARAELNPLTTSVSICLHHATGRHATMFIENLRYLQLTKHTREQQITRSTYSSTSEHKERERGERESVQMSGP